MKWVGGFLIAIVVTVALAENVQAATCGCTAIPITKTYQNFTRHEFLGIHYATSRKWTCQYQCVDSYGKEEVVLGSHYKKTFHDDDGTEGVCDGIGFVSQYSSDHRREIHFPENDKPQFIQLGWSARFSPSAPELKSWLKNRCQ